MNVIKTGVLYMSTFSSQTEQGNHGRKITSIAALAIILLVALATFLFFTLYNKSDAKDPEPSPNSKNNINVGVSINDSPGFNTLRDGQRSGFDVDVANYIANRMDKHANFVPITVGSRNQQLKEGFVDMVVSTYSITDAHITDGIIFAGPYIRTEQGIMTLKSNTSITSVSDLAGETVCVTTGSTSALKLDELKKNVKLIATYRDTLGQCIEDMKNVSNNVVAVTSDAVILQGHARASSDLQYLPSIVVPGTYEKYGIGISKKNPELCKQAAKLLKDFISTQWNSAFAANLQGDTGLASSLKPDLNTIDSESCRKGA